MINVGHALLGLFSEWWYLRYTNILNRTELYSIITASYFYIVIETMNIYHDDVIVFIYLIHWFEIVYETESATIKTNHYF